MRNGIIAAAAAGVLWFSPGLDAQTQKGTNAKGPAAAEAKAELKGREGKTIGRATLTETPNGVLLRVALEAARPGGHAFHIHEAGRCDPPKFESAGGHFNPAGGEHGFLDARDPHAGDLPNIHVPQNGRLTVEILARGVTLGNGPNSLFDSDGSALVMHSDADDYRSNPAGDAGNRVACGVIQK